MKPFLIIDTFNFLHRAYHALPKTFTDPNGEPTNAVYGVTSMIINVLGQIKPFYATAALDSKEPTFRLEDFTAYKAQRKPMEDDLASQIPKVLEVLDAFGIKQIQVNGYEADDIIATLTKKFEGRAEFVVVSNDKDLWQLVNDGVKIMLPQGKGEIGWVTKDYAFQKLGLASDKIADFKGLRGDASDNIPGVYGIGEKTAVKLISQFGSVEEVYKNLGKVEPESLRRKLEENYEQALMSKRLAQLIYDVPFTLDIKKCVFSDFNRGRVKQVLEKYNFKSLIKRLGFDDESDKTSKKSEVVSDNQLPLF